MKIVGGASGITYAAQLFCMRTKGRLFIQDVGDRAGEFFLKACQFTSHEAGHAALNTLKRRFALAAI